jgi:hypothetical protein
MKIAESAIQLASTHTAVEYSERQESLAVWKQGRETVRTEQKNAAGRGLKHQANKLAREAAKVSLSEAAKQRATEEVPTTAETVSEEGEEVMTDLNMRILRSLFEKLTGRKIKLYEPASVPDQTEPTTPVAAETQEQAAQGSQGWGLRYEYRETHHESESTQFQAQGVVLTTDGQQIEIEIELNMSRSFTSINEEAIQIGQEALKDPLVLNLNGTAAQLTQETFSFDIDADGTSDNIAFVGPDSGFLALDSNGDGVVNDGSELFGALSGDGFADLAAYDGDGNGWIDENDDIFSRLRIWMKTATGEDQLLALREQGVGAIYLGRVDTPFSIKDGATNALQGEIRSSGLFLFEEGGAGTMQQLDLVA